MRLTETLPPRSFTAARGIELTEVARVQLGDDELLTFVRPDGAEYDVVAKEWGFFATPSVNSRLRSFGMRTAILVDAAGKRSVALVSETEMDAFERYLAVHDERVEEWLDER